MQLGYIDASLAITTVDDSSKGSLKVNKPSLVSPLFTRFSLLILVHFNEFSFRKFEICRLNQKGI